MKLKFDRLINLETKYKEKLNIPAGELWKVTYGEPGSSSSELYFSDFKREGQVTLAGPLQLECGTGKLTGIAFKVVDN